MTESFFSRRARKAALARWDATPLKDRKKAARAAGRASARARLAREQDEARRKNHLFVDFMVTATGPVTEDEKDRIYILAKDEGLSAWTIARRIGRHPSTVSWILTRLGFKRIAKTRKAPFERKGKRVIPFSEAEDAYMLDRSKDGANPAEITREMNRLFPHSEKPRSRDTISCRLMMLASDEAAREAHEAD